MQPTGKRQRRQWRNGLGADKPPTGVGGITTNVGEHPNLLRIDSDNGGGS